MDGIVKSLGVFFKICYSLDPKIFPCVKSLASSQITGVQWDL